MQEKELHDGYAGYSVQEELHSAYLGYSVWKEESCEGYLGYSVGKTWDKALCFVVMNLMSNLWLSVAFCMNISLAKLLDAVYSDLHKY